MEQPRIMTCSIQYTAVLARHPRSYSRAVNGIEARVCWIEAGVLALTYTLEGDIKRISMPQCRPPRRADYLWRHTCFEAFVSVPGKPGYYEFNFAPSGEWAAYRFRRYRDGAPLDVRELAPKITARSADDRLDLDAAIHLHCLPMLPQNGCLGLGLSAVIEEENGVLSYWALKHPPGKPDFHHPDGIALEIERPDVEIVN
jgi:hypothetical protein